MQLKGQSSRHLEVGGVDGLVLVCVKFSAAEALNFRRCLGSKKLGYIYKKIMVMVQQQKLPLLKSSFFLLATSNSDVHRLFFVLFFFKIILLL